MTLQGCPDVSLMVCFHCNNGQGYYATGYSGAYSQEASERSVLASRACINTSALTEVIAKKV